jgi:hypothetical protein
VALATALLTVGLARHLSPVATGAEAQNCCWAPQAKETGSYWCRPARETR